MAIVLDGTSGITSPGGDTSSTSHTTPIVKSASSLTLQTNGTTTAVTIDASQNVGIGTATPGIKVDVNGGMRIQSLSNPSSGAGMELGYDGTQGVIQIYSNRATQTGVPLLIGTGQIKFPATQIASTDPNVLDDYEEGTWNGTITATGSASGVTYSSSTCTYIKIGQLVFVAFDIRLSNKGTLVGSLQIGNLPFTTKAGDYYGGGTITYWSGLGISVTNMNMKAGNGNNNLDLSAMNTGGTSLNQPDTTMLTNSSIIMGTAVYQASA